LDLKIVIDLLEAANISAETFTSTEVTNSAIIYYFKVLSLVIRGEFVKPTLQ